MLESSLFPSVTIRALLVGSTAELALDGTEEGSERHTRRANPRTEALGRLIAGLQLSSTMAAGWVDAWAQPEAILNPPIVTTESKGFVGPRRR